MNKETIKQVLDKIKYICKGMPYCKECPFAENPCTQDGFGFVRDWDTDKIAEVLSDDKS